MARELKSFFVFGLITALFLCFQNCDTSTRFIEDQYISNIDLSLLVTTDTVHHKISLHTFDYNTGENSLFAIQQENKNAFNITENDSSLLCDLRETNALDQFNQLIENLNVSHPSMIRDEVEICSRLDLPAQYLSVSYGNETLYILFKNDSENSCLSFNPYDLIDEGKRTFITDSVSSEEINEMIQEGQAMLDDLSCSEKILSTNL